MNEETRERSFDELAKGLAAGTVSRRKAIRLMGAALVGGALASVPGAAWAAKGGGGGKSACAKYCKTLFGGDTVAHEECVSQGAQGTGPCFACGGPAKPAPTCSGTQTLNSETCQCVTKYSLCSPGDPCCADGRGRCLIVGVQHICATASYPVTTSCDQQCADPGSICAYDTVRRVYTCVTAAC